MPQERRCQVACSVLEGTAKLSSRVVVPVGSGREPSFSASLPAFGGITFSCSRSDRYVVIAHRGFRLHFPDSQQLKHLFMSLFAIRSSSLDVPVFCPLSNGSYFYFFPPFCFESSLYSPAPSPLLDTWFANILSTWGLSSHPLRRGGRRAKVFVGLESSPQTPVHALSVV